MPNNNAATFLFYISLQHFDPSRPTGGASGDGFFGRPVFPQRCTDEEAARAAKLMLDEARSTDRTFGGLVSASNDGKFRVRVRKIVEFEDSIVI